MKEFASKNKNLSTRSYDRKSRNLLRRESGYFPPPVFKIMFLFVSFFGVFDLGFSILRAHLLQAVFEKWRLNVKFRHLKVIRVRKMMPKSIDLYVTTNFPEVFSKSNNYSLNQKCFLKNYIRNFVSHTISCSFKLFHACSIYIFMNVLILFLITIQLINSEFFFN